MFKKKCPIRRSKDWEELMSSPLHAWTENLFFFKLRNTPFPANN